MKISHEKAQEAQEKMSLCCGGFLSFSFLCILVPSYGLFFSVSLCLGGKLFQTVRLVPAQRKIFPQSVTLPIVRQEYAPQIRMTVKNYAEQIVCFSFVPIGSAPNSCHGWHVRVVLVQQNLEAQ